MSSFRKKIGREIDRIFEANQFRPPPRQPNTLNAPDENKAFKDLFPSKQRVEPPAGDPFEDWFPPVQEMDPGREISPQESTKRGW